MKIKLKVKGDYLVEAFRNGKVLWKEEIHNLVTNVAKDSILNVYLHGSPQIATWYVGLLGTSPTFSADDTMGSHPGWAEVTDYSESTRPEYNEDQASQQAISNGSNKATFSINSDIEIGGAFIVNDSVKGGTAGILLSEAQFNSGKRELKNGDVLSITYTISLS